MYVHVFYVLSVYSYIVVHKQNVQMFNIQMFIFHYKMEYFDNMNSSCPLRKQLKDKIIFLGTAQYNYMCA